MTSRTGPITEPRAPLSKQRVLRAAIDIADKTGIESLTMRRLAQELGVEAMSLYYYVKSKDELLAGIVEVVEGEIELPTGGDWKSALRRSAVSFYDVLMRHRWACRLMTSTVRVSRPRIRWMEAVLRRLREAGFSTELTDHAYHALDSHIVGFTLWQVSFPFKNREELADLATSFLKMFDAAEYPYMVEHVEHHLRPSTAKRQGEFEFGLDLILDSLERLKESASPTHAHPRAVARAARPARAPKRRAVRR